MEISNIIFSNRFVNLNKSVFKSNNLNSNNNILPSLTSDVFQKEVNSYNVNNTKVFDEDDTSFKAFKKWADKTDFYSRIEDIVNNTGKILGHGMEGTVYEIPDNKNWVIKKYKRCNLIQTKTESPMILETQDISPKLNIGQQIAIVQLPVSSNLTAVYHILRRQEGKSMAVSYTDAGNVDKYDINQHINFLKKVAEFPQESFEKLISDITYINEIGYLIDCGNPHNLMIDDKNKHINFVDIMDKKHTDCTQYGEVLFSILDSSFGIHMNNRALNIDKQDESIELSNIIIEKFLTAMKNQNAKFSEGMFFDILLETDILNDVLGAKNIIERVRKLMNLGLI